MADKVTIEVDNLFLKKFFSLTDRVLPEDQEVTILMLRNQLVEIEEMINDLKNTTPSSTENTKPERAHEHTLLTNEELLPQGFDDAKSKNGVETKKNGTVLIIDDLGVITYQLGVVFKKYNFDVISSNEIYEAIEKYKKQEFDMVVMDLFIPTEREGFILLDELQKISQTKAVHSIIGVMSASSKKEHKLFCKNKGAKFYIEKVDDWQKELMQVVKKCFKEK